MEMFEGKSKPIIPDEIKRKFTNRMKVSRLGYYALLKIKYALM